MSPRRSRPSSSWSATPNNPDADRALFVNPPEGAVDTGGPGKPAHTSLWHQVAVLSRRQVQLLLSSRRYLVFLIVAPLIVGLLPLVVGGDAGFTKPPAGTTAPFEPRQIISLLNFGAILLGTTLTVRDLIAERATYRHEQAAGLSAPAYLLARTFVFGAVAVMQSALLVLIVTAPGIGKPRRRHPGCLAFRCWSCSRTWQRRRSWR